MEVMALRQSPARTAAGLAANRGNSQKCTRSATHVGKAGRARKGLKYGAPLPPGAGKSSCGRSETLYRWFHAAITATLGRGGRRRGMAGGSKHGRAGVLGARL